MTYDELKDDEIFLVNDIKVYPKVKVKNGYVDLVSGNEVRDSDIPETFKTGFQIDVIDLEELNYLVKNLQLDLKVSVVGN